MQRMLAATALALVAQSAFAVETDLSFDAHLAGSVRHLDSDFEAVGDEYDTVNNASKAGLALSVKHDALHWFARVDAGEKNEKAGIESLRQLYAGVDTPLGQLLVGRKANDYRLSGERLDPFYDTSVTGFNGREAREGASFGLSNLTNGFTTNTVAYTTPSILGGLRLNAAGYFGREDAPNDETDYAAGADYVITGPDDQYLASAGVQYIKIENPASFAAGNVDRNSLLTVSGSPGKSESVRVHGSFRTPRYSVGVSFENVDVAAEPEPRHYLLVSGSYSLNASTQLAATYGKLDFEAGSPALSGDGYSLGVIHKIGMGFSGYLAARQVMLDVPGDSTTIALGLAYDFEADLGSILNF